MKKFVVLAAISVSLLLSACEQRKPQSPRATAAEITLGCDAYACVKWINVSRQTMFWTNVGELVDVSGREYKQLKDGSQKSSPEKFHHLAFCSKTMPAYAYSADGKLIVDWLSPNNQDGVFGYNQTDYVSYLETCHSAYGQDIQELARKFGYAVDPQYVNQAQFDNLKMFGEAIGDEGEKRSVDASLVGKCTIKVSGHTYSDGKCLISITSLEKVQTIVITDVLSDYFAYINVDGENKNSAEGSWNGVDKGSHAQDELGSLTAKGDCWTNQTATLCYRWLGD
jgi:hypothetical protein